MSDDSYAEIIRLYPDRDAEDEDAPLHRDKKESCTHRRVSLDPDAKRVRCRDCDREVSAFDFLARLAGDWEYWVRHRKEAERRARLASTRLEELLRLENNARARLRRLDPEAKTPERPWGHGQGGSFLG